MLNATEVFQDEHGRSVEGHIYRRDGQVQLLQGDGEEHGVEVVTLELERFHWFYVHGIRVHNKGGGGGGGTISFCCCNNGFQWNGQACVQCPGTRNGTSTVDASASFTASDGGTPADFEPERRLDGLVLPFGADYHPMHLDLNCVDNVYIQWSNFWPLCGANQHTCQTPDRCCCNQNMEWRDGSCQACRPGSSTCEHNLAIDGSNYWFGFCQWSDGGSHSCYLPLEHSGLDNKYCCCLPHKVWDGNGCRPSPTPVSQEVIPGSNFWWMCNDWQGYYDCNAYGVTPKTGGWMGFFMLGGGGMILTFCLCCFACGTIAVKLGFARSRTYQDRAESCKRQGHVTSPETCQSMASRDSSYREAWICDRCNREFKPGVNEPFYRCQQCGVDFCSSCNDRPGPAND